MGSLKIYKMIMDGDQYVGTAAELAEVSGYHPKTIGCFARGELKPRDGVSVEVICCASEYKKLMGISIEWEEAVKKFRNVKWVNKGTPGAKQLEVSK